VCSNQGMVHSIFLEGLSEIRENPRSRQPVCRPKFEPMVPRITFQRVTAMLTRSIDCIKFDILEFYGNLLIGAGISQSA
jgi:hypothetical protein